MSKVIGFKAIIKNMVECKIRDMIWDQAGWVSDINDITFDLTDTVVGYPTFTANATVRYNDYTFTGFVDEYGNVSISLIRYERMVCRVKDENGDWIMASARPVTRLVYGDALAEFRFKD